MCSNHVTAIPAANHSQHKYFKEPKVYDTYNDEVVRLSRIGNEVVAEKTHLAMVRWLHDVLEDPTGRVLSTTKIHGHLPTDMVGGLWCMEYTGVRLLMAVQRPIGETRGKFALQMSLLELSWAHCPQYSM